MDHFEGSQQAASVMRQLMAALDRADAPRACELVGESCRVARMALVDAPWWLGREGVDTFVSVAVKLTALGQTGLAREFIGAYATFFTHAAPRLVQQLVPVFDGDVGAILAFVAHAHSPGIDLETFGIEGDQIGARVVDLLEQEGVTAQCAGELLPLLGATERRLLVAAALRRWPNDARLWHVVGATFLDAGEHELARRALERGLGRASLERPFTDEELIAAHSRGASAERRGRVDGETARGVDRARLELPPLAKVAILVRHLEGAEAACAVVERLRDQASLREVALAFQEAGAVDRALRVLLAECLDNPTTRAVTAVEAGRMLLAEGRAFEAVALAHGIAPVVGGATGWLRGMRDAGRRRPRMSREPDTTAADGAALDHLAVDRLVAEVRPSRDDECGARDALSLLAHGSDHSRASGLSMLERVGPGAARVVHESIPGSSGAVRRRLERLLVAWAWDWVGKQACLAHGVAPLELARTRQPAAFPPPNADGSPSLARWREVHRAVDRLELERAEALVEGLYEQATAEDGGGRDVPATPASIVEVAETLAADGRQQAAMRVLIAMAPAFAHWAGDDGTAWARCRELLGQSASAALEFGLRRSSDPHGVLMGHPPEAVAGAAQELIAAKRLSLPNALRVVEALPRSALPGVLEAAVLAWPSSSALLAVMGLQLVERRRHALGGFTLYQALELREAQRAESPEAYVRTDGRWWNARPVQAERQRVLMKIGTADDGAMLLRDADPPHGLERATPDRPILEIVAIVYAHTRSQEEAEAAVLRFGSAEPPLAFLLACQEIGRLDLAIAELERRAVGGDGRPGRSVLAALTRAYLEAGRHMDAMLVPRVFGGSARVSATAVYALLDCEEVEWFGDDDEFAGHFGPRVDESAGRQQAIDALLAVSVPTREDEEAAERLIARLGGENAVDVTQAVEDLRSLGVRVSPVVERHCREGDEKVRAMLGPMLEGWAWGAAEAGFGARVGRPSTGS